MIELERLCLLNAHRTQEAGGLRQGTLLTTAIELDICNFGLTKSTPVQLTVGGLIA